MFITTKTKAVRILWWITLAIFSIVPIVNLVGIVLDSMALWNSTMLYLFPLYFGSMLLYKAGMIFVWILFSIAMMYPAISIAFFYKNKQFSTISCYVVFGFSTFFSLIFLLLFGGETGIIAIGINLIVLGLVVAMDVLDRKAKKQAIQETVQEVNPK